MMNLTNAGKATFVLVSLMLLHFAGNTASAQAVSKDIPLKVLLIGNSFSQNAATYLPELAKEKGYKLELGRAEIGGCSLEKHWELSEIARKDPNNPKGHPYKGKSLQTILSEQKWDIVTLQQNSMNSTDISTYRPYAKELYNLIKKLQPDAEVVLHQTWAYRLDSKDFGQTAPKVYTKSAKEMYDKSRAAYHEIAKELQLRIIPVGDAFWKVASSSKWGFKEDSKFDFSKATAPTLPNQRNSLHMGYSWKKDKLSFDSHHANNAGKYLGSLVWYSFLFKEPASKVKFSPDDVPADFAKALKKLADQ